MFKWLESIVKLPKTVKYLKYKVEELEIKLDELENKLNPQTMGGNRK